MKINQILWVIDSKTNSIVPVKVVEKLTKENEEGTSSEFIVLTLDSKKVSLDKIGSVYYDTLDGAKQHLYSAANELIEKIVDRAQNLSKRFGNNIVQSDNQYDIINLDNKSELITLPDGTVAKLKFKE